MSSDELFDKVMAAETPEDEMRLLLSALPPVLAEAVWAMAVPHWFDVNVLAALLPERAAQAAELYAQLQRLAYVEPYLDRGHSLHELNRHTLLNLWWQTRRDEYRQVSARAESYFASQDDDVARVEAAYHLLVTPAFDSASIRSRWGEIASRLKLSGQFSLAHTLVQNAREHITAGRVLETMTQLVSEWERALAGELESLAEERRKARDLAGATEIFAHARRFYADLSDPRGEANVLVKLGAAYRMQNQPEAAREQLESALEMYKAQGDMAGVAKAYAGLGDISGASDDLDTALIQYNQGLAVDSSSSKCLAGRGRVYRLQGKIAEALADFTRVIELDSHNDDAFFMRGTIYAQTEQYESALMDLSRAIELDPNEADYTLVRAAVYVKAKRDDAALVDIKRTLELSPISVDAFVLRSDIYERMTDYDAALADATRAIELAPKDVWAVVNRGGIYRLMKQYNAALADLNRAIELDPKDAGAITTRGLTHRQMKQYDAALADFNRAIELDPNYVWAIIQRGVTYRDMKKYDKAIADFNKVLEFDQEYKWAIGERSIIFWLTHRRKPKTAQPTHTSPNTKEMARALIERGRTHERKWYGTGRAIADFSRAVKIDPNHEIAFVERGQTYLWFSWLQWFSWLMFFVSFQLFLWSLWLVWFEPLKWFQLVSLFLLFPLFQLFPWFPWWDHKKRALADFTRAIELDPEYDWAIASRGEAYQEMKQYNAALADFTRAIELDPNYTSALRDRAFVYKRIGQYDAALADFNRLLEIKPNDAWALAHRGTTYRLMGKYDMALVDLDHALELNPKMRWARLSRVGVWIYPLLERVRPGLGRFLERLLTNLVMPFS